MIARKTEQEEPACTDKDAWALLDISMLNESACSFFSPIELCIFRHIEAHAGALAPCGEGLTSCSAGALNQLSCSSGKNSPGTVACALRGTEYHHNHTLWPDILRNSQHRSASTATQSLFVANPV